MELKKINLLIHFNSNVGLIGFGNLAKSLLPLLKPFNCKISVFDPWLSNEYLESQGVNPVSYTHLTLPTTPYV